MESAERQKLCLRIARQAAAGAVGLLEWPRECGERPGTCTVYVRDGGDLPDKQLMEGVLAVLDKLAAGPFCELARKSEPASKHKPLREEICGRFETLDQVFERLRAMAPARAVNEWERLVRELELSGAAYVSKEAARNPRHFR